MRLETVRPTGKPAATQEPPTEQGALFAELLAASDDPSTQGIVRGKDGRSPPDRAAPDNAEAGDSSLSLEAPPGAVFVLIPAPVAAPIAAPGAALPDDALPLAPPASPSSESPGDVGHRAVGAPAGPGAAADGGRAAPPPHPTPEASVAPTLPAPASPAMASVALKLTEARKLPEILAVKPDHTQPTPSPALDTIAALQPAPAPGSRLSGVGRLLAVRPASGTPQPGKAPAGESAPAEVASSAQTTPLLPLPTPPASLSPGFQPQQGPFRSDSMPAAAEATADAPPAPLQGGDQGPPQQPAGPVQEVRLAPGQREGLAVLLGVSSERDRAEVQAEAPMLLADLAGVGAKVEAIRVEVAPRSPQESAAGWASGQHPGSGPGAGQPGQEEALARAIKGPAHGDRASEAARLIDHGGKVDRYA